MTTLEARQNSSYRWVMLGLATLSALLVIALPTTALSVLFKELSIELNLSLVQIGFIWGTSSLTGMFMGLGGGLLADRFGTRRMLIIACLGTGLAGALRSLTTGFVSFIAISFLMGLFMPSIGINTHKVASQWFRKRQLGLANGVISSGFASGFLLGSLLGASVLSPWLGGWRNVLVFFGGLSVALGIAWYFVHPKEGEKTAVSHNRPTFLQNLPKIFRLRAIWLIGLGKIGFWGCMRGFTGYLPLYLRDVGWQPNRADAALATFFTLSLCGAILIPMLSDRLGQRKPFLIVASLGLGTAVFLLGFFTTPVIFIIIGLGGLFFDAFMALSITTISEAHGVGPALAGTAIGATFFLQEIGGMLAPPIGNSLASLSPNLPFFFWGGLALLGTMAFAAYQPKK